MALKRSRKFPGFAILSNTFTVVKSQSYKLRRYVKKVHLSMQSIQKGVGFCKK